MALGGRPLARLNSTPASRKARTASMVRWPGCDPEQQRAVHVTQDKTDGMNRRITHPSECQARPSRASNASAAAGRLHRPCRSESRLGFQASRNGCTARQPFSILSARWNRSGRRSGSRRSGFVTGRRLHLEEVLVGKPSSMLAMSSVGPGRLASRSNHMPSLGWIWIFR
jgi:hypothetical protein